MSHSPLATISQGCHSFYFLVLVIGCYNTRHDNTKKRYTLPTSGEGTSSRYVAQNHAGDRVYRIGMDEGVTAHYNLWEGQAPEAKTPSGEQAAATVQPADLPVATPEMAGQGPIIIEASDVLFDFDNR